MYKSLKKGLFFLLPNSWIYRFEYAFRYVYSLTYAGSNVMCNLCGGRFNRFVVMEDMDQLCSRCGSLSRHRRLWMILKELHAANPSMDILHFSPSRILSRRMKKLAGSRYQTSDPDPGAATDHHYDLTLSGTIVHFFDLVICYHVLEHIERDREAMSELFRILKPGGMLLVQTPLKRGDTYENAAVRAPKERKAHFGQDDHVRIYSASGLAGRLADAGFVVSPVTCSADLYFGLGENETVFFCKKGNFEPHAQS